jgi:hypothetical protein
MYNRRRNEEIVTSGEEEEGEASPRFDMAAAGAGPDR